MTVITLKREYLVQLVKLARDAYEVHRDSDTFTPEEITGFAVALGVVEALLDNIPEAK